jgi:hypothetical protein
MRHTICPLHCEYSLQQHRARSQVHKHSVHSRSLGGESHACCKQLSFTHAHSAHWTPDGERTCAAGREAALSWQRANVACAERLSVVRFKGRRWDWLFVSTTSEMIEENHLGCLQAPVNSGWVTYWNHRWINGRRRDWIQRSFISTTSETMKKQGIPFVASSHSCKRCPADSSQASTPSYNPRYSVDMVVVCFEARAKMAMRAQRACHRGCTCSEGVVLGVINYIYHEW